MAEEGSRPSPDGSWSPTGAQQALDLIGKIFIDPGDEIAVEAPAYVGRLTAFGAYEPRYLQFPLDDDGLVVSALEEALVRRRSAEVRLHVPNFSNPAGVTMSLARRERLVEVCRRSASRSSRTTRTACCGSRGSRFRPCARSTPTTSSTSERCRRSSHRGCGSDGRSPSRNVDPAGPGEGGRRPVRLVPSSSSPSATSRATGGGNLATLVERVPRSRRDAMLEALTERFPGGRHLDPPCRRVLRVGDATDLGCDTQAMLAAAVERRVAYVPGTAFYPGRTRAPTRCGWRSATRRRTGSARASGASEHLLVDHASLRPAATA